MSAGTPFTIDPQITGEHATLRLTGELDIAGIDTLRMALDEVHAAGVTRIVFDMRELAFIDSTGVCELLRTTHQGYLQGCSVEYLRTPGPVTRTLELMRVSALLPLAA